MPVTESVGEYLATQRRLRSISLDELCQRTKIPRRNLECLEAGDFDGRTDGFARGFVRAVALNLGLDADEAVMRMVGEPKADDESFAVASLRAWLGRLALLVAIAAFGFALWRVGAWLAEPDRVVQAPSDTLFRRDVVSDLAADRPREAQEPESRRRPPEAALRTESEATLDAVPPRDASVSAPAALPASR